MSHSPRTGAIVAEILKRSNPRAPSLIVSVLGDSIKPHGGSLWMGSLIDLMASFGINARLVRTATFRLAKETWLCANQIGRRSYYSLTESGNRRFDEAFHRVYEESLRPWNGAWSLVIVDSAALASAERDKVRHELVWAGFGIAAPFVFAHTSLKSSELAAKLDDLAIAGRAVVMASRLDEINASGTAAFVRRCWDLDALGANYRRFIELFQPLWQAVQSEPPTPEQAFVARTLLIHEFRRITLRDPQLPEQLLPPSWEGSAARVLARNLYRALDEPTERHLMSLIETADGPLPGAAASYFSRFGGLR